MIWLPLPPAGMFGFQGRSGGGAGLLGRFALVLAETRANSGASIPLAGMVVCLGRLGFGLMAFAGGTLALS